MRAPQKPKGVFSFKAFLYKLATGVAWALFLLISFFPAGEAWAHSLLLKELEAGILEASYEGSIPARRAVITIYDEEGNILKEGRVDTEGLFYFDPQLPVHYAQVDDGMGHRGTLYFHPSSRRHIPKTLGVLGGLALLLAVAALSWTGSKRREESVYNETE